MKSGTFQSLFWIGARRRNPSLVAEYERVKESEWLSRSELDETQLERASQFLHFAGQHSPYYRRVFQQTGFSPRAFAAVSDLGVLPPIEKQTLISSNREIHASHSFPGAFVAETSGTTGSALEFRKSERWDSINRAYLMRSYDWYGVKPWDRNGYLWGYDIDPKRAIKVRMLDALQNRFRIFSYTDAEVRRFAERLSKAAFVGGYSSMVYEVARIINRLDLARPRLRMVKGTSEMILDAYQPEVSQAFGTQMVSEYGAAEAGLIAFECPHGSMHINMEDVIVEVEEDGGILVTNLASYSFPVIRYRLGDAVKLGEEPCACGRAQPVIDEVVGRKGGVVAGRTGSYPALTFYYVFKNLAITRSILLNYKAVQERKGEVTLFVQGLDNREFEPSVREQLEKYFSDDITFEFRFVAVFDKTRSKAQYFESRLT